jgi:DNA-binding GntR family transcriptional regulator
MSARPSASTAKNTQQVVGRRTPARAPSVEPTRPLSVDAIHQRVWLAIVEHRLPPGTKLGEERLAKAFGVSRTQIRQVIERLAHDSIVSVQPNRGAFVSSPTVEEAREVFAARRLIEPDLIRKVASVATPADVKRLREHVALESAAREGNDRRSVIRLSGEFHQIVADVAGNRFLARTMRELEALTCLVISLYDAPNMPSCPYHEHSGLIDAIEAGDGKRAAALMIEHLNHVEGALEFKQVSDEIDFDAVFA